MLLGCLKTLQRPYQILDWYWALAFLWQNNNIAKCADGRVGKPHSKGSKFLVSKCLYCFSPDWLEKPPHSSHFPKCYSKRHQKPFVRQMSCRSWEKVAVNFFNQKRVFKILNLGILPCANASKVLSKWGLQIFDLAVKNVIFMNIWMHLETKCLLFWLKNALSKSWI